MRTGRYASVPIAIYNKYISSLERSLSKENLNDNKILFSDSVSLPPLIPSVLRRVFQRHGHKGRTREYECQN